MYTGKDIAKVFEEIAPIESGISGDELGFVYGDPDTQVTGLACLWNIH
jgi:putative NIF3 family GTP cyclohydrolase 1 type 2